MGAVLDMVKEVLQLGKVLLILSYLFLLFLQTTLWPLKLRREAREDNRSADKHRAEEHKPSTLNLCCRPVRRPFASARRAARKETIIHKVSSRLYTVSKLYSLASLGKAAQRGGPFCHALAALARGFSTCELLRGFSTCELLIFV